jgi:hypothetical protein
VRNGLVRRLIGVAIAAAMVAPAAAPTAVVAADANVAPTVQVDLPGYSGMEPSAVLAVATFTDPEAETETYTCAVDFGDGTVVAGSVAGMSCTSPAHQYRVSSNYVVTVTVTDSGGAVGTGSIETFYYNDAPWVGGLSLVGDRRLGASPHAVAAIQDPGRDVETYTCSIDYGDGSPILAGTYVPIWPDDDLPRCVYPDHAYAALGTYLLTAVVTDSGGESGSTQYYDSIVLGSAPELIVSAPDEVNEGAPVAASATFAPAEPDETHTCSIDFGDGTAPQPGVVSGSVCTGPNHVYGRSGDFTITVSLTGSLSPTATASKPIIVWNVPPAMTAYSITPAFGKMGASIKASIAFTDPGTAEAYTVVFDWGDGKSTTVQLGSAGRSASSKHVYTRAGVYTLSMMLSDGPATDWPASGVVGIYDPARTLSGSGSVVSPANACLLSARCGVDSTAVYNVNAKYAKGATRPTVCIAYSAAGFSLTASSADWFAAANGSGSIQGTGKVNGVGGYTYRLSAVDGRPDSIDLKVWSPAGALVYDLEPARLKTGSITIK